MSPVVIGSVAQPRTIVITPNIFSADESTRLVDSGELPKYAVGLFESNGPGPRKRKRLTHLTPEEKIMRRKLKNRVAAQTARDRKKARMETLEEAVAKIHQQTTKLFEMNSQLLERTQALEEENMILRRRLGLDLSPSVIAEKNLELSIIKKEFEGIQMVNHSNENFSKAESSDDEGCVVRSFEGEELTVDKQSRVDVLPKMVEECRSPVPAAFGERIKERLIPQQQEAVQTVKLIHSKTRNGKTTSLSVKSTETQNQQKIQTSPPSLGRWKPSILNNVSLRQHQRKEAPLDLRIR